MSKENQYAKPYFVDGTEDVGVKIIRGNCDKRPRKESETRKEGGY
jgi:hypothetical protein